MRACFTFTLAVVGLGLTLAAPARAEDPQISDQARAHFKAGVNLLQDPDGERVEDAYREFRAAYAASASPKILGNVGYCAMRLERDGEAIAAYERYLRENNDVDPEERAQISRDLQTMQVGLVRVEIAVDLLEARISDVRIPVKGGPITNLYGPVRGRMEIGIRPGHHIITVKADGYQDNTWEIDAVAGSKISHSFDMRKPPPPPPPAPTPMPISSAPATPSQPPIGSWMTMGVGGALLGAGAITGILALKKTGDISSACPQNTCPPAYDLDGNRSSARGLVRATDYLLIGGGVVLAAGVTWLVLSGKTEAAASASMDGYTVRF